MITYVSLVIDLNISFSNMWFTVTSVRLYRKVLIKFILYTDGESIVFILLISC